MTSAEELFQIGDRLEKISRSPALEHAEPALMALVDAGEEVGRAFSGSWLGYHSTVYYKNLRPPPAGAYFSQEWGLKDLSFTSMGSKGEWLEWDPHKLCDRIRAIAGTPNLSEVKAAADQAKDVFRLAKDDILSILLTENTNQVDPFLTKLIADLEPMQPFSAGDMAHILSPKGNVMTRDMIATGQGIKSPPRIGVMAEAGSIRQSFNLCLEASEISRKAASHLERKARRSIQDARVGTNVFIGHGRAPAWRELKDFIQDRLHLPWDEFNRVPVAGVTNQARLAEMLDAAAVAFIIMTAEDEMAEGQTQARMNVIHEVGLFQGRLGFTKAIVMLEEGCQEFSNIQGLGQIRFPARNITGSFEDVRSVLERERIISG